MVARSAFLLLACALIVLGCDREERDVHVEPSDVNTEHPLRLSELRPGTTRPATQATTLPTDQSLQALAALSTHPSTAPTTSPTSAPLVELVALEAGGKVPHAPRDYRENAYALSEGKRLFSMFNCVGCHAHGGGGMGPPLMDDKWLYGYEPDQVFATIVQGRPNGMPSFGGRVPDYQVWQLAAYVRSMAGYARKDAAPGRDDHMRGKPPEHSTTQQGQTTARTPPP